MKLTFGTYLDQLGVTPQDVALSGSATPAAVLAKMILKKNGVEATPAAISTLFKEALPTYVAGSAESEDQLVQSLRYRANVLNLPLSLGAPTVTTAFLQASGLAPNAAQVQETQYELSEALQTQAWKTFVAPFNPSVIGKEESAEDARLHLFAENVCFPPQNLTRAALTLSSPECDVLDGAFASGDAGRILAATFVQRRERDIGDFSRVYGEATWKKFVVGTVALARIAKGTFLQRLDLALICEISGGACRDDAARALLEQSLTRLKASLGHAQTDVIDAIADFERSFTTLHPFSENDLCTARLFSNRLLRELDLPPPIFREENSAETSELRWRVHMHEAIARTKYTLGVALATASSLVGDRYLAALGVGCAPGSPPAEKIFVAAMPYALGRDGFLYDLMGAPHLILAGELIPLAQMEHYVLCRRLSTMTTVAANIALADLTAETRTTYAKCLAQPDSASALKVCSDANARRANADYRLHPHEQIAKRLAALTTTANLDKARAFEIINQEGWSAPPLPAHGSGSSSVMSKYTQLDLEWWYIEKGLRDSGSATLADGVHHEREKLFLLAQQALGKTGNLAAVSENNPYGFAFRYEAMMFRRSPLRFASLAQAIDHIGDDHVTVWRGDYGAARFLGMAPNNDVRQADARSIAKERAQRGVQGNLLSELHSLERTAVSSPFISLTSDLSLLKDQFATKTNQIAIGLGRFPKVVGHRLSTVFAEPKGKVIANVGGVPGDVLKLTASPTQLIISASRKVFELQLPKAALLPGLETLFPAPFTAEQELHGLRRVQPWNVRGVYEHTVLAQTCRTP